MIQLSSSDVNVSTSWPCSRLNCPRTFRTQRHLSSVAGDEPSWWPQSLRRSCQPSMIMMKYDEIWWNTVWIEMIEMGETCRPSSYIFHCQSPLRCLRPSSYAYNILDFLCSSRGHQDLTPECPSSNLILSGPMSPYLRRFCCRATNWITEKPVAVWASGSGQLFGRQRLRPRRAPIEDVSKAHREAWSAWIIHEYMILDMDPSCN